MLKEKLLKTFLDVVADENNPISEFVTPYTPDGKDGKHQLVFFIKPEATDLSAGVNLSAVLDLFFETAEEWNISIAAARVFNGNYLRDSKIIDQHYGVINAISKNGQEALSQQAKETLASQFKEDLDAGALVLGGHQFLEQFPDFNPVSLVSINDNIGTVKLAGGSYALAIRVLGEKVIILNPFHPYQLLPYTSAGRGIIALELLTDRNWADLRQNFIGATDPSKAVDGSIRASFRKQAEALGMKDVSQGTNGVHLSAGPLEGMVELARFFSTSTEAVSFNETAFGKLLLNNGLEEQALCELAKNPDIEVEGQQVSAFDLTEEINAAEASMKLQTPTGV